MYGWNIDWKASGLTWRLDEPDTWYLESSVTPVRSVIGFVQRYQGSKQHLAMYSQPMLSWYRLIEHGTMARCCRSLLSIYESEDRENT